MKKTGRCNDIAPERIGRCEIEPDEAKLIRRHMIFERDHNDEGGRVSIVPSARYRVVSNDSGPANLDGGVRSGEVNEHRSEGELEMDDIGS